MASSSEVGALMAESVSSGGSVNDTETNHGYDTNAFEQLVAHNFKYPALWFFFKILYPQSYLTRRLMHYALRLLSQSELDIVLQLAIAEFNGDSQQPIFLEHHDNFVSADFYMTDRETCLFQMTGYLNDALAFPEAVLLTNLVEPVFKGEDVWIGEGLETD